MTYSLTLVNTVSPILYSIRGFFCWDSIALCMYYKEGTPNLIKLLISAPCTLSIDKSWTLISVFYLRMTLLCLDPNTTVCYLPYLLLLFDSYFLTSTLCICDLFNMYPANSWTHSWPLHSMHYSFLRIRSGFISPYTFKPLLCESVIGQWKEKQHN